MHPVLSPFLPIWYLILSLILGPSRASPIESPVALLPQPRKIKWSPVSIDSPLVQGPYEIPPSIALQTPEGDQLIRRAFVRTIKNIWSDHRVTLDRDFDLEGNMGMNSSSPSSPSSDPGHTPVDVEQIPLGNYSARSPTDHAMLQNPLTTLDAIVVDIALSDVDLQLGVDESYVLRIPYMTDKVLIEAKTVWGAIRALATFEQLVGFDKSKNTFVIPKPVAMADAPLYPHRGIMIDTSRNFYDVESLLRQIDAMNMAKLNVLHWHISDSQSWPIMIQAYPNMTKDAYSTDEKYSPEDIRTIVGYAWERGVRVIPEIDMPGHSNAGWRQIDPSILACPESDWQVAAAEPVPGQLNPVNNKTYEIVSTVYREIEQYFPDNLFHVGFDELNPDCYNQAPDIQEWLKAENKTYKDLATFWVNQTLPIFHQGVNKNRRLMMWEDSVLSPNFGIDIPKNVVMQSWGQGLGNVEKLLEKGYDVVISSHDFFYLDCGYGNWIFNDTEVLTQKDPTPGSPSYNYGGDGGSWCGPYKSWQRIYNFDFELNLNARQRAHVMGAELALWSEQSDSYTVDNKVWPRAAAFAELLWSGNRDANMDRRTMDLSPRLMQFRQNLVRRGLSPAAIAPKYCMANPDKCAFKNSE